MSRMMNPGPPDPGLLFQARTGDRPWPGEPAWHRRAGHRAGADPNVDVPRRRAGPPPVTPDAAICSDAAREPTLVLDVDLREPLPDIAGGVVTRAWLMLRVGGVAVGELLIPVPEKGLSGADLGRAVAARIGSRRRAEPPASDAQPRSRNRGSTSSL